MDQRAFTIIFVIITVIAVAGLGFSKWQESASVNASPSPSPSVDPLFSQSPAPAGKQQAQQQAQPKQMKQYPKFPGTYPPEQLQNKQITIKTSKGDIVFDVYPEATKAASNFIFLTQDHFYDGLTFHRVVPGFVIQGGDPSGNGTGGPGYKFEDEPVSRKYDKGIVAMANSGPNTNGSQFFIMLDNHPELPPNYTIFGKVASGQEVVDQIKVGDIMQKVFVSK